MYPKTVRLLNQTIFLAINAHKKIIYAMFSVITKILMSNMGILFQILIIDFSFFNFDFATIRKQLCLFHMDYPPE